MLEKYGHGGDLRTAAEAYGLEEEQFLDFSSNMNPLGPPPSVRSVLNAYAERIHAYPDPAVRELKRKLARLHAVEEDCILVGNGAAELIDLAVRAVRPAVAALARPSFTEYEDAVRKAGCEVYGLPLEAGNGFELGEGLIRHALERSGADLYIVGSPNNPTGKLADPEHIRLMLSRGAFVVLDEAFLDFVPGGEKLSMIAEAATSERLVVLRSMTKFYAIPGIRLGYAIGSAEAIGRMKELQVPWSVNSLAQSIGEAVLDDAEYAERTIRWLAEERPWLADRLRELGMEPVDGAANYLLVRLPDGLPFDATRLQREMGRRGVLIRDASRFPGLDGRYIRLAVKLRDQNAAMLSALQECLSAAADKGQDGTSR